MRLLIDKATYSSITDYSLFANDQRAVINKSSQGYRADKAYSSTTIQCIANGVRVANYHWIDPLLDPVQQADIAIDLANKFGIRTIAGDTEQWWSDWDLWWAAVQGKYPMSAVPRLPSKRIYYATVKFHERLNQRGYDNDICYTRWSFIKEWCPQLEDFVKSKPQWFAEYHWRKGRTKISWADFEKLMNSHSQQYKFDNEESMLWQATGDRFEVPGHTGLADINKWQGTDEQWERYLPLLPIPPVVDYRVTNLKNCSALNVREKPNAESRILKTFIAPVSDFLVKKELEGKWAKLYDQPGYVHSAYLV